LTPRHAVGTATQNVGETMDGCGAAVVAEKYAAEIEAVRDELPDPEHVLVRDSEYEAWLARRSAVDPDPPSLLKIISSSATSAARPAGATHGQPARFGAFTCA